MLQWVLVLNLVASGGSATCGEGEGEGGVGPNIEMCETREVGGGWGVGGRYIV